MKEYETKDESAYLDECPGCGTKFIGMTISEWRENHARSDCPKAPFTALYEFEVSVDE